MSASPRVLLVGAYERDNVGDLLFLLVTERYLDGADVVAAAPFAGDMRALLDREIPAYGPLLERETFDAIWTVGGQVGRVDARRAYRMSASPEAWRAFEASSAAEQAELLRGAASPYIPLPFAYPRNAGALTVLNSVGIAGARGREAVVTALRSASAIAVRDRSSSRLLTELGIDHRVVPDAVHALSRLHPGDGDRGEAAIVQISSARLRMLGHRRVGEAIARSAALRGRPVRLLLAGTATGHDSVEDYERVVRAARGADVEIVSERRPLALAEEIRRARVVVGTSLHVRIVAAAYGVPRVSLSKPKPTRYAQLWDAEMPFDVALGDLDDAVEAALRRGESPAAAEHAARLSLAAHENLERLAELVLTGAGDAAGRLAARQRHELAALARRVSAQEAELAALRHEVAQRRRSRLIFTKLIDKLYFMRHVPTRQRDRPGLQPRSPHRRVRRFAARSVHARRGPGADLRRRRVDRRDAGAA